MARGGGTRSPSPAGNTTASRRGRRNGERARSPSPAGHNASARRGRRIDGRFPRDSRDDARSYRRRSRSPSADRKFYDRDDRRRRERSLDRRNPRRDDDNCYRPGRDRSRERRRERSPVRDRRERDYRDRRDDSRDRTRRRRDDSADSRRKARPEDNRDRTQTPKPPPQNKQAEEDKKKEGDKKKADRLAKLEAWKAKQAAEKERKLKEAASPAVMNGTASPSGTRNILDEMDRKAQGSQIVHPSADAAASPAPYAGKFDPKALTKKAAGIPASSALGLDVSKFSASLPPSTGPQTNGTKTPAGASKGITLSGNVTGFGFGGKPARDAEKPTKKAFDFGEEESTRRKLERLPTPPLEDGTVHDDAMLANGMIEEDDDDIDITENGEEEAAAAARAAAEKRQLNQQAEADAPMTEAPPLPPAVESMEVDEEDPLDAFMNNLNNPPSARASMAKSAADRKGKLTEPNALFSDDEGEPDALDQGPEDILAMAASKKKKKDIPTVDHSKVNYESFRKSFYHEPSELAEMTEDEVADLRLELGGIKVRGTRVPKPVVKWAQCGLGVQILDVIRNLGYEKPTAIQSQAIPAVMSGRDVVGIAKTGSGKTIAFLLPMIRHIKDQRPIENLDGPITLILAPTRELATQIARECKPFAKAANCACVCCYGGSPIKDNIAELKKGAEILVCTPGRLIDLLAANSGRVTNLRRVTYVVLDEADRMFDMGFEPQIMKILNNIRPDRQTVMFSATFPKNMEALARKTLKDPVEIIVGGRSVVAPEVDQQVEVLPQSKKFFRLLEILGELYKDDEDVRTLIFVDRHESADSLLADLMRRMYSCVSIHGGREQVDRDQAIQDFKHGYVPIMIATSVAARGLDVKQLKLVVNYDAPNHLEDYVHRVGRTGRAGNKGTAVTFLTEEQDKYAACIARALRLSDREVPEAVAKMADSFKEKVASGKDKAHSGFGGRGLEHLVQQRESERNRERKMFKTGDEPEEDEAEDKEPEKIVVKVTKAAAAAPAPPPVANGVTMPEPKIVVHRKGESGTAIDKVKLAAEAIAGRLSNPGKIRPGQPIDNKGPDAGEYHATLEINDYPQKARWAVTNRTNVFKILEATGTSITTKGSYYSPGKEPGAGENPKLYILVEGPYEQSVNQAMNELVRLLKEGTMAAADSEARAPASGRYSVL